MRKLLIVLFIIISLITFADDPVVVASKIDTEGALLGNMIVLILDENGIPVEDRTEFGTTSVIRSAIINGEIDIYPEYTGNGGFFFEGIEPEIWKDAQKGYEMVKKLDYDTNKIVWLTPANANNTWAIAIRQDFADQEGIVTLSDFADYINEGGFVKLAGSEEFITRPDSLPAFQNTYGFELTANQLVTFSGGNTAQTERAAALGIDDVNAAMAYGTDGALAALGLIVLEDNLEVQPVYEPTPIIREEVLNQYPEIADLLQPVFESLDLEDLQSLNSKIAIEGENAKQVAEHYLKENGFIE
ncbi:MAG: ABC transporter substrate-binding protein [Thermotogota bacterium]